MKQNNYRVTYIETCDSDKNMFRDTNPEPSNIITTLRVDDILRRVFDAAGEGDSTALPAGVQLSAVEVDIQVPVIGPVGATARPIFLGKVDEILQVNVIPVGLDIIVYEEVELVFDPVFKDEGKDPRS